MIYKTADEFLTACRNGDTTNVINFINNPTFAEHVKEFIRYSDFKAFRTAAEGGHTEIVTAMIAKAKELKCFRAMINTAVNEPEKSPLYERYCATYMPFHLFRIVAANGHGNILNILISSYVEVVVREHNDTGRDVASAKKVDLTLAPLMNREGATKALSEITEENKQFFIMQKCDQYNSRYSKDTVREYQTNSVWSLNIREYNEKKEALAAAASGGKQEISSSVAGGNNSELLSPGLVPGYTETVATSPGITSKPINIPSRNGSVSPPMRGWGTTVAVTSRSHHSSYQQLQ